VLVKADYSQIELRLAAKIAGDRAMIAAYARGDDLHALTARQVLGRAEVTKADRQTAKAVNFGLLFGAGAKTLAAYARSSYGVAMTEAEAGVYRRKFFATYPGLRAWHDRAGATRCLAVCTHTVLGRRRSGVTSFTEKLNSPVQGSAADGLKAALALLWERRAECPTAVPVLFVHDEVVVEVDEAGADAARAWLVGAMVDGMRPFCDPVPVEVEATVARTWGGD
jgi:DNA polymerase-1